MMLGVLLLLQATAPQPQPQPLPSPHGSPVSMICPVGGERFSAWQPTMYSTYGERPDGRPYSYLPFPFPLPECPGNRLIVLHDYTPEEIERLEKIVASPEYRAMTGAETSYYRGYWLATQLGRPAAQALSLLLQATWETTPRVGENGSAASREQSMRYQAAFVRAVADRREQLEQTQRSRYEARAANALRQLGRFDEADAMRARAMADLDAEARADGWATYLDTLGSVIARRDASVEPLDMIPAQEAARRCLDDPSRDASARSICAQPAIVERITEMEGTRATMKR